MVGYGEVIVDKVWGRQPGVYFYDRLAELSVR
jgi:hypothetical protein